MVNPQKGSLLLRWITGSECLETCLVTTNQRQGGQVTDTGKGKA